MIYASFEHLQQFSEKQRKEKTLYTKEDQATEADWRAREELTWH
jgi:hypothetical protein